MNKCESSCHCERSEAIKKKENSTRLLRHYNPRNDGKRESTHNSPIHSSAELVSVPDNRIDSETSSDNLN